MLATFYRNNEVVQCLMGNTDVDYDMRNNVSVLWKFCHHSRSYLIAEGMPNWNWVQCCYGTDKAFKLGLTTRLPACRLLFVGSDVFSCVVPIKMEFRQLFCSFGSFATLSVNKFRDRAFLSIFEHFSSTFWAFLRLFVCCCGGVIHFARRQRFGSSHPHDSAR